MASPTTAAVRSVSNGPYRVMLVDDAMVVRGLIARVLKSDPEIEIVASIGNGQLALDAMRRHAPEVVILDIEMPVMDGMTALPKLLEIDPSLRVIMASTLTLRGAQISMEALAKGAADYVPKPTTSSALATAHEFKRTLLDKVKALGAARRAADARSGGPRLRPSFVARAKAPQPKAAPIKLRKPGPGLPEVLAVGSSTGGPQALIKVFSKIRNAIHIPVLITQHMPATFTTILAEHLQKSSGVSCREAVDGEPLVGDRIYVAPGDHHMLVRRDGNQRVIALDRGPPINYCRPAVDPMLASVSEFYGRRVLAVILTGMGHDGQKGCESVVAAGGTAIAQDEATSIVWGMPGAAATAGLCSAVLPVDRIAPWVQAFVRGRER